MSDTVQEKLRENKQRHRLARQGARYLLQGLVMCRCCGYAMCARRYLARLYHRRLSLGDERSVAADRRK